MWLIERDKQMGQIAKKKIELERLQEERKVFDEMQRKKKLEMEAITNIIKSQDVNNQELIQRALDRKTDLLKKYNGKKEGVDYTNLNLGENQTKKDKQQRAQMFKQLEKVRANEFQNESKQREEKVQEL